MNKRILALIVVDPKGITSKVSSFAIKPGCEETVVTKAFSDFKELENWMENLEETRWQDKISRS